MKNKYQEKYQEKPKNKYFIVIFIKQAYLQYALYKNFEECHSFISRADQSNFAATLDCWCTFL